MRNLFSRNAPIRKNGDNKSIVRIKISKIFEARFSSGMERIKVSTRVNIYAISKYTT